ncbi:MAG: acyl-CoA thioester hydrolase/BAAT C-terminal domain-containing protein [Waddliaceae bacterium]
MEANEFSKIKELDIREQGVVGKIFFPDNTEKAPAIIIFSGSDGGFNERQAKLFAKEGYVALALAFFHAEGLPESLENIPLEYFLNAIRWLKSQPQVKSDQIHLYGPSKGGELVLVLASTFFDEIASIIAVVPSCVTFGGIPNEKNACWTFGGNPLPIAPTPSKEDVYKQLETRKTVDLVLIYLNKMQDTTSFEKAFIKVENIKCPVLLISGKDDRMWPSWIYGKLIMQRLDEVKSPIFREHISYDNVGHMITNPYDPVLTDAFRHPVTGLLYEIGGNPKEQEAACKDSWGKILLFLSQVKK